MHVTYAPEDGDHQEWTWKPGRVRSSEAELIEKTFGGNWDEFVLGVQQGKMAARRVLLWHLLRRDHPTLNFRDVPDFYAEELTAQFGVDELVPMRDRLAKAGLPDSQRELVLAGLDLEITEASAREEAQSEGKANSAT